MPSMAMIDHRLAGFADRSEIGSFQSVVTDDVAFIRFADDRVDSTFGIQPIDPFGYIEVRVGIRPSIRFIDSPSDGEPVSLAIVTDPVFRRSIGWLDVGMGMFSRCCLCKLSQTYFLKILF